MLNHDLLGLGEASEWRASQSLPPTLRLARLVLVAFETAGGSWTGRASLDSRHRFGAHVAPAGPLHNTVFGPSSMLPNVAAPPFVRLLVIFERGASAADRSLASKRGYCSFCWEDQASTGLPLKGLPASAWDLVPQSLPHAITVIHEGGGHVAQLGAAVHCLAVAQMCGGSSVAAWQYAGREHAILQGRFHSNSPAPAP